jgi:predicted enzyme related to lactoylglutathione lyase
VVDGGWLYVIEDASSAGKSLVTIAVTDLEEAVAEVTARGIAVGAIEAVGDAARKAATKDPDGNSLALIEVAK